MGKYSRIILLLAALAATACEDSNAVVGPSANEDCRERNSATVAIRNESRTNRNYDMRLDGVTVVSNIPVGQTGAQYAVVAGVPRRVEVFYTVAPITPACRFDIIPVLCSQEVYSCRN